MLQLVTKGGNTVRFAVRNDFLAGVGSSYLATELYERIHDDKDPVPGFVLPERPAEHQDQLPPTLSPQVTPDLTPFLRKYFADQSSKPSITELGVMSCINRSTELGKLLCESAKRKAENKTP